MKTSPMTNVEVDEYINKITQLSHAPGGQHDIEELRRFFTEDDGEAFYTVNLYKYHQQAQYLSSDSSSITGVEAYDKFSRVMVGLLFQNYSYPVFGSNWLSLTDKGWDRIVIVRYRSRRDMAEIFADPKFSIASADKWASIEKHDRFVVKALHLPEAYMLLILFISIVISFIFAKRRKTARRSTV